MSSPNHPTFDIEDVFSSNSPDYTSALPDYFPASPGNTSHDPLNDLTKDLLALVTFPHFYDDPYMKVMQAYHAKESPIPPPTSIAPLIILPPSLMTSTLEMIIKDIQVRYRSDKKDLLDAIYELKNRKEGPPDY
nr:hypothetical protein [Tanacetum cinerariifolium]